MTAIDWGEFERVAPEISRLGHDLIHQYGIGLGFIATVRKDGGPRVHPCCPIIHDGGLFVFILAGSPKRHDLDRDGRFALHSNPCADNDDEFYCSGIAERARDADIRRIVAGIAKHDVKDDEVLYELRINRALHTTWRNPRQPDTEPIHTKWIAV